MEFTDTEIASNHQFNSLAPRTPATYLFILLQPSPARRKRIVLKSPCLPKRIQTDLKLFWDSTEIGCGRYGEVLLATLKRPSQVSIRVAVKELRTVETRGVRKRIALRLARELRIWAEVCHLNILPLIGFYLSDNYEIARFISPLMINGNVSEYLERTQVGGLKRLDITNILINDAHQAVLCDFGLALFIQESGISSGLTTSRSVKGSLRYMSPELNLDDEAKHTLASDVWAWGCTAFEVGN
ncbi:hypothetical protein FRC00_010691 [Tulasnella sp. 408]|nr:hypothetical protein FRC00_010691 [Tulasnella sp. 408]